LLSIFAITVLPARVNNNRRFAPQVVFLDVEHIQKHHKKPPFPFFTRLLPRLGSNLAVNKIPAKAFREQEQPGQQVDKTGPGLV